MVRNHPKMYEMVSDRSSRAEKLTDRRKISMRIFFNSNKCGKNDNMVEKNVKMSFVVKNSFEKLQGPYQSWKNQENRDNLIKFNKFNYL